MIGGTVGSRAAHAEAPAPPGTPDGLAVVRASRPWQRSPRDKAVLVPELEALESRLAAADVASAERPVLIRRLADDYAELASAQDDLALAAIARRHAIDHYATLRREFPKWCLSTNVAKPERSTGCLDEALYFLAYEHERGQDVHLAQKTYLELIQSWPGSRYIPLAYAAFGEMYLDEAATDPTKLALAQQAFEEAVRSPASQSTVRGYAYYKLGLVLARKGEGAHAAAAFKQAIQWAKRHPKAPAVAELRVAAQRASVATSP